MVVGVFAAGTGRQLYRPGVGGFRCRDCIDLAALERVLREGGVDLAELVED